MLTLPRQRLGQPGKAVGAKHHRAEPAGKRIAQAGDRLVERTLRDQRGAAKERGSITNPSLCSVTSASAASSRCSANSGSPRST